MKKLCAAALIVLFSSLTLFAKGGQSRVWDHPVADKNPYNHDGYFKFIISPTRVEFTPDETIVDFESYFRPNFYFTISRGSVLRVDDKEYALKGAENIVLDKKTFCPERRPKNFRLIFEPLPIDTKKFDFIESKDSYINGISDPAITAQQLIPSTWRNDLTGDWEIGLFNEGVVYDAKFWVYVGDSRPTDRGTFKITDGEKTLSVKVGKLRKGTRKFQIGNSVETPCSMITSRTLPDYPTADTREKFKDTRYTLGDTAVIRGWLKDSPKKIRLYAITGKDLVSSTYGDLAVGDVDSMGHFTVKVPLINSTECFFDWENTFIRSVLEPGETYYLLYDFGRGQKLFMGADCRVQNELLSYPLAWSKDNMYIFKKEGNTAYLNATQTELKDKLAELDSICHEHPNLSTRFRELHKGNIYSQVGSDIGQSRFSAPDHRLPDESVEFLSDILRNHSFKPYTLHRDYFAFIKDFVEDHIVRKPSNNTLVTKDLVNQLKNDNITPEESALIDKWEKLDKIYVQHITQMADTTEQNEYRARFQSEHSEMLDSLNRLLTGPRAENIVSNYFLINTLKIYNNFLDSLGADDDAKSIRIAQEITDHLDHTHRPFSPAVESYIKDNVTLPDLKKLVLEKNDEYKTLEQRVKGASLSHLTSNLNLPEGVRDGKALLDSIIAPHRGKIVLLDVWGTWCSPCRQALAESQKEYQELSPYDMVYVYLANNSPEDSWKNIIEEYNIKGDNCYHYNLPADQQGLIEKYLQIGGYPTYKLFDREGNLLPYNVDARNLKDMKYILDKL